MLKVKSFKFSEDTEINQLLSVNRIAQGAHILVSNGEVIIPYEDGAEATPAQRIIALKEQKNTVIAQMDIIEHSQRVLGVLLGDARERLSEIEHKIEGIKGSSSEKDALKKKAQEARSALAQLDGQKLQNDHELARLTINIEMFDAKIKELEGTK